MSATTGSTDTLKWRLSRLAEACAYVRKEGRNDFHKYNYATAAQIFERVNEALAEQQLVSIPHFSIHSIETRTNQRGGTETLATVECTLRIEDLDGEKAVVTRAYGAGMDNGDKAIMKAQTAALKYAWIMLLNISTGDDPEADSNVDARMTGKTKKAKAEEDRARAGTPSGGAGTPNSSSDMTRCSCGSSTTVVEMNGKHWVVCMSAYMRWRNAELNNDEEEVKAGKGDMKNHFHRPALETEIPHD